MRHQNGTLFDEFIPAGSDTFTLYAGTGAAQALAGTTRAIYFPAAVAAFSAVNGEGTTVGPMAIAAGTLLPIATKNVTATSAAAFLALF